VGAFVFQHGKHILLCGIRPNVEECWILYEGKWSLYNSMNFDRHSGIMVSMKKATYIFGGGKYIDTKLTSETLNHKTAEWQKGPDIPHIINYGCGVSISDTELLLIGGYGPSNAILMLNVANNTWPSVSIKLKYGRRDHRCIVFNKKVIITGGTDNFANLYSTEIVDFESGDLTMRQAGDLNVKREYHGMGIITLNGVPTVIAFGGQDTFSLGSVEIWNDQHETWELSKNLTISFNLDFAYGTFPTKILCP